MEMTGVELIAEERQRQIDKENWTADHDDQHTDGELAMAAVCYAAPRVVYDKTEHANGITFADVWPFEPTWDKRSYTHKGNVVIDNKEVSVKLRIRLLVMAGALIAAEIDRLKRIKK